MQAEAYFAWFPDKAIVELLAFVSILMSAAYHLRRSWDLLDRLDIARAKARLQSDLPPKMSILGEAIRQLLTDLVLFGPILAFLVLLWSAEPGSPESSGISALLIVLALAAVVNTVGPTFYSCWPRETAQARLFSHAVHWILSFRILSTFRFPGSLRDMIAPVSEPFATRRYIRFYAREVRAGRIAAAERIAIVEKFSATEAAHAIAYIVGHPLRCGPWTNAELDLARETTVATAACAQVVVDLALRMLLILGTPNESGDFADHKRLKALSALAAMAILVPSVTPDREGWPVINRILVETLNCLYRADNVSISLRLRMTTVAATLIFVHPEYFHFQGTSVFGQ